MLKMFLYLRAQRDSRGKHFLSYTIKVCTFSVFYHDKNIKQKFKKEVISYRILPLGKNLTQPYLRKKAIAYLGC